MILAPKVSPGASAAVAKKKNVRLLEYVTNDELKPVFEYKKIMGGLLVQDRDEEEKVQCKVVTKREPTADEMRDMLFAWKVCQFVKSNAIVYCKDNMTFGIGAGQMSRVFSSRIAVEKAADAKLDLKGIQCS